MLTHYPFKFRNFTKKNPKRISLYPIISFNKIIGIKGRNFSIKKSVVKDHQLITTVLLLTKIIRILVDMDYFNWTATSLEIPASCIVTPKSVSAISIVSLLWVITRNWVSLLIDLIFCKYRPKLTSSKGASTSSSRQKGLGWNSKIAKSRLIAVNAFSPPESKSTFWSFFPGGWAMISMPEPNRSCWFPVIFRVFF